MCKVVHKRDKPGNYAQKSNQTKENSIHYKTSIRVRFLENFKFKY